MYFTRTIISQGLYIFYPIIETNFFVFKDVFQKILSLWMASTRAVFNQEWAMMAQVQ